MLINGTEKRIVQTRKNTSFEVWRSAVLVEFEKLGVDPAGVTHLRLLHAWEGGDTTQGFAQHVAFNNKLRARTLLMKQLNKDK